MSTQPTTRAKVDRAGPLAIIRFQGDITSASKDAVFGTYDALPKDSTREILLDFAQVPYLNSSGIALVIQVLMEASKAGQRVQTFGLTPHFQKVFTMVGLTKYTSIHADEASARAAAQQ